VNNREPIITLTTDFGGRDGYVGIVRGIILALNPDARLVDIAHDLPPFNIETAAYLLKNCHGAFPPGTVHLAVVDPGVGTDRAPVLIETRSYYLIGPDNGLFGFLSPREIRRVIVLNSGKYFSRDISRTFHARDIFAPAAGYLSLGIDPTELGPARNKINREVIVRPRRTSRGLVGRVVYVDRFGNLASSITEKNIPQLPVTVYVNGVRVGRLRKTFGSVKPGRPVAYINSFGHLEIAVNRGSAAEYFGLTVSSGAEILIASD